MLLEQKAKVTKYYEQVWLKRMQQGHNGISQAFHYGYSPNPKRPLPTQEAKLATNRLMVDHLGLQTKKPYLISDLGCGVGGTALYITDVFPNSHVIAVNIDKSQLDFLTGSANFRPERVSTLQADFTQLPFEDNALDGAYAIESSCHANDKDVFYKEAMRSLKPGSKLVVLDYFYKRPPLNTTEHTMLSKSHMGWMVPGWHLDPASLGSLFVNYSFRDISDNMMPDINRSFQKALEKLEITMDPIIQGHCEAIIALRKCMDLGLVQYGLLVISKPENDTN